ncbi:hypothetical protein EAO77_32400 [Streptomyces sp. t39]|nr:hypothetical protein EAO77_32400 [Streptomyces sp. t39]
MTDRGKCTPLTSRFLVLVSIRWLRSTRTDPAHPAVARPSLRGPANDGRPPPRPRHARRRAPGRQAPPCLWLRPNREGPQPPLNPQLIPRFSQPPFSGSSKTDSAAHSIAFTEVLSKVNCEP